MTWLKSIIYDNTVNVWNFIKIKNILISTFLPTDTIWVQIFTHTEVSDNNKKKKKEEAVLR